MTVNSTTSRVSYAGNGTTTTFSVPFYFLAAADLVVIRTSTSGTQTTLVLSTDYTVSGVGNPAGGSITCTTAPAVTDSLVIYRDPAATQLTDYQANDPFPAETHERALDKLTMIAQRLKDMIGRSFRLSDGDPSTASTTLPTPQANTVIGWDSSATGLRNVDPSTLASVAAYANWRTDVFSGNGVQTTFVLFSDPGSINNLDVSIGGVTQTPLINYTFSGTSLTFTTPPPSGTNNITVRYGQALPQVVNINEWVSPEQYNAFGDGVAVDTAALQAAINTGKCVRGKPGANYLTGPLTQSTPGQVLDFSGCTLTRINSSPHAAMVTLNGARAKVVGGRWNGNKAGQSGTVNDQYSHAAVTVMGDYCVVEGIESVNSWGIGVKGVNCSYASIRFNKTIDPELFGIFVECTSADKYGNEILDNYAASVGLPNVSGIYLTGTNDFLINQYFWKVCRNTVQCSQDPAVTGICITTRGYDGVCNDNNTTGGQMGISGDSATRSTFSGNRCSDTSGAADYGIEINNSLCTVVGNAIDNCKWGISISGAVFNQNYTTISGNVINPKNGGIGIYALGQVNGVKTITGATSANPIQFTSASHGLSTGNFVTLTELPGDFATNLNGKEYAVTVTGPNTFTIAVNGSTFAGYTSGGKALRGVAQYLNITGNTVKMGGPSALTGGGGTGIYLAGRTEYSTITGNTLAGPGQVIPDGNGIFLDNSGGYCSIVGNKFSGFTTPLGLYAGVPTTFTDINFSSNDCTYDCPPAESLIGVSGGATVGARVTQMWNNSSSGVQGNILDVAGRRSLIWTDGVPTPESRVAGALGSLFVNPGYGEGNTLYVKEGGPTPTITGATSANPIQITTSGAHGFVGGVKNISAATSANPIQFTTSTAHFFKTGIFVQFGGLPGSFAALNGNTYQVTVTGANTFTVAVNGTGFPAYTSGGTATPPQYAALLTGLPGSFAFLNGKSFPVTVTGSNTFTIPVNGSAYAAYTTGGLAQNLNEGWIPVNSATATFAQLNDATADINTLRKRFGRLVTDTTNNRQFFASGSLAADPWYSVDGTQTLTPGSGLAGRNVVLGNLEFSGAARRITGDLSNATVANRVYFQTSTTNGASNVGVLPNGTGNVASWNILNSSDPANASVGQFQATSTAIRILSGATGTGSVLPFSIFVGGAEQAAFGGGNSSMRSLGSFGTGVPVTVNAATYTVLVTEYALRFTTTNCTVTLPSASSFNGRILLLSTVTANSVTSNASNVVPLGSSTPGTAILAATAGKFAMLQSDGSNWFVLMAN